MASHVIVVDSEDFGIRALQLAHVLPFTVTLESPTDTAGELGEPGEPGSKKERARIKKGLNKEYEAKIKAAKRDLYVGEDAPSGEPVEATFEAPPAEEPESEAKAAKAEK